jgi:peptidyl-prolyl cis-trans isomerase SurA
MYFKKFVIYISLVFIYFLISCSTGIQKKTSQPRFPSPTVASAAIEEPALLKVGNMGFTKTDITRIFESIIEIDSLNPTEAIDELVKRKLMILEAQTLGYNKDPELEDELESQKKVILNRYVKNDSLINAIKNLSFENYKYEINASHIFVPISKYASPEDTFKLFNELVALRKYARIKDNFAILAKEWSKDPNTYLKGGNLGWFTSLQVIFPLELVAFKTPIDSISMPVRTKVGYHLLKINDKRKNSGSVRVQHIWKNLPTNVTKIEFETKYKLLDSLKKLLDKGANFNALVKTYSDDMVSKDKMGELPIFGIGTREESTFEEAAFDLNIGEVSKPLRSSSGLHLIKLLEKQKPLNKEAYFNKIDDKITTDSRGEYLTQQNLTDLKKRFRLVQNIEILNQCLYYADNKILEKKWRRTENEIEKFVLFSIDNERYLVKDYFEFIEERQKYDKWRPEEKPAIIFKMFYDKFLNAQLQKKNEEYLLNNDIELKTLIEEQKNDILISRLYNNLIINKSLDDTTGRRKFYEINKNIFPVKETVLVKSYSFADSTILNKFNALANKEKPYQLYNGIRPMYFRKNAYFLDSDEKRKLIGLITILNKKPSYKVEIGGHTDANEEERISQLRIKQIVDYLVENGLPLTRILENDYKSTKPQDRFDWSKNQRASFQFYSDSESDLVKIFNDKVSNSIYYENKNITKQEFKDKYGLIWKNSSFSRKFNGRIEVISTSIKIEKKNQKQNSGEVIKFYQNYLKDELMKNLKKKYKIDIESDQVFKIVNELKQKNK